MSRQTAASLADVTGTGTLHASRKQRESQMKTLPASRDGHRDPVLFFDHAGQSSLCLRLAVDEEDSLQPGYRTLQPCEQFTLVRMAAEFIQLDNLGTQPERLSEDGNFLLL